MIIYNILTLSTADKGYSRNSSCALNYDIYVFNAAVQRQEYSRQFWYVWNC